jgi:hypothetical protein
VVPKDNSDGRTGLRSAVIIFDDLPVAGAPDLTAAVVAEAQGLTLNGQLSRFIPSVILVGDLKHRWNARRHRDGREKKQKDNKNRNIEPPK